MAIVALRCSKCIKAPSLLAFRLCFHQVGVEAILPGNLRQLLRAFTACFQYLSHHELELLLAHDRALPGTGLLASLVRILVGLRTELAAQRVWADLRQEPQHRRNRMRCHPDSPTLVEPRVCTCQHLLQPDERQHNNLHAPAQGLAIFLLLRG